MYENGCNGLEKILKLYTTQSSSNMHLFNSKEHLEKYNSIQSILKAYFTRRIELFEKRKDFQINKYRIELKWLSNKAKYILENLDGTIDLRRKKQTEIDILLESKKYDKIDNSYKYLVKMPMDSVTEENVEKLQSDKQQKTEALLELENKPVSQIWFDELLELEKEYRKQVTDVKEKTLVIKQKKKSSVKKLTNINIS